VEDLQDQVDALTESKLDELSSEKWGVPVLELPQQLTQQQQQQLLDDDEEYRADLLSLQEELLEARQQEAAKKKTARDAVGISRGSRGVSPRSVPPVV